MHYLGPGFKEMVGKKFSKEINYDATSFLTMFILMIMAAYRKLPRKLWIITNP